MPETGGHTAIHEPLPEQQSPSLEPATKGAWTCTKQTFPRSLPLAEASGAAYLHTRDPRLVVVADSGNRGRYIELDPASGQVRARGRLPLDLNDASDDLEGLTAVGNTIYGITSSGWVRHWRRTSAPDGTPQYRLIRPAYPLQATSPTGLDLVCHSGRAANCARNFEGLCLHDASTHIAPCAGFAVSKTDGALYCLIMDAGGTLAIAPEHTISISRPQSSTGCHFTAGDRPQLWVGNNLFDGNRVLIVKGWEAPAQARTEDVGPLGLGFGEAIIVGPATASERVAVFRFSDTASRRSWVDKYFCE